MKTKHCCAATLHPAVVYHGSVGLPETPIFFLGLTGVAHELQEIYTLLFKFISFSAYLSIYR